MFSKKTFITRSARQTVELGKKIARLMKPDYKIYLYGELGSGKTTLIKGICRGLNVKEEITSPSFVVATEYRGRLPIAHIDLYRLGPAELETLPVEEYFVKGGITIIEWADRLPAIKNKGLRIFIKMKGKNIREIIIENSGN
ncbi:MAG: tRNA (adenosine(37)-N6)-threonylcarbamoyltransferase complex ATPase subunit type 1 TsaE [candidate division WOR-3 bacterium]